MRQQDMEGEFIEDIERADNRQSDCLGDSERKGGRLVFVGVWGFLWKLVVLCICPLIQELVRSRTRTQVLFLGARGLGMERPST